MSKCDEMTMLKKILLLVHNEN